MSEPFSIFSFSIKETLVETSSGPYISDDGELSTLIINRGNPAILIGDTTKKEMSEPSFDQGFSPLNANFVSNTGCIVNANNAIPFSLIEDDDKQKITTEDYHFLVYHMEFKIASARVPLLLS